MKTAMRILIADDRPRSRAGLRALLGTYAGVVIVGEAMNGEEAVQLVDVCHPGVVVMDARMPAMDGLAATRAIKARWPDVRVVMLTMYGAYQTEALCAGVDAFLIKGCAPDMLLYAILGDGGSLCT